MPVNPCKHHWMSIAVPAIERAEGVEPAWCSLCGALKSRGIHSPTNLLEAAAEAIPAVVEEPAE